MEDIISILPLITGFLGVILGSLTSIVIMHLQLKAQKKREMLQIASQLALEEYTKRIELAKINPKLSGVSPLSSFLHYNLKMLSSIEKGKISQKDIDKIYKENQKLIKYSITAYNSKE